METVSAQAIANTMSMSVAPVFLISSVALLLGCMSSRYGRVIDRTRTLLRDGDKLYGRHASSDHVTSEIRALYRRAKILRTVIILAASSIFFVVMAIFVLFLNLTMKISLYYVAEASFLISLVFLLASLGLFIEDFLISLSSLKLDINTRGQTGVLEADGESS